MIRKNRVSVDDQGSVVTDGDNYGDALETKHKQWLERRNFIFNFFIFLGLALLLVVASVLLTKRKDEDMNTLLKETMHNSNELLHNMEKKLSTNIESIKSLTNEKYHKFLLNQPHELAQEIIDVKKELQDKSNKLIEDIRTMKITGTVIETSAEAQIKVNELQETLRKLIPLMYGEEPYTVEMLLKFPESMPDYVTGGPDGKLLFELAPLALAPYSTSYFLEVIAEFKVKVYCYVIIHHVVLYLVYRLCVLKYTL